jgi:hypothetical protein
MLPIQGHGLPTVSSASSKTYVFSVLVKGGEAVCDTVMNELQQILPNVGGSVGMELGDAAA